MPEGDRRRRTTLKALAAAAAAAAGRPRDVEALMSETKSAPGPSMVFSLPAAAKEQAALGEEWREYLSVERLSVGIYALKKGATDTQSPHQQDEIYYVAAGRAVITVEGKAYPLEPGSVVYVARGARHKFHDITEDLTTLVFFAPAYKE
jgi:mannose-6-phosphate isomerase-like protein (cupin superfamily)